MRCSLHSLRLQRGTVAGWPSKPEACRADEVESQLAWCSVMGLNLKPSKGVSEKAWFSLWASAARATTLSRRKSVSERNEEKGETL